MCWNSDISLNTFVFGLLTLVFVFFTNTFYKYKIPLFSNPFLYVFILEVISVQLFEFLLWKNLDNKILNQYFTFFISLMIVLQPPTLAMMIKDLTVRYRIITSFILYFSFIMIYFSFREKNTSFDFYTKVAKNGHLDWRWVKVHKYDDIIIFLFLAFYLISAYFIGNSVLLALIFISLAISLYFYLSEGTFSSMWCWLANFSFILIFVYTLIVLPFYEYNRLC